MIHYDGPLTDSSRWARITQRPDDVFICTPPKSGTTWTQAIIGFLIAGSAELVPDFAARMPWIDVRHRDLDDLATALAAQHTRRCLKSHTPRDGLPYSNTGTYFAIYRHPLDVHFSMRKHAHNLPLDVFDWHYPDDPRLCFQRFLEGGTNGVDADANSLANIMHHYQTFTAPHHGNVHLFHYADMCRDLPGQMRKMAEILGVSHTPAVFDTLVEAVLFDNMKSNAGYFIPAGGTDFWKSDAAFFESGSSNKWQGHLTEAEYDAYDCIMQNNLSKDARQWLECGAG